MNSFALLIWRRSLAHLQLMLAMLFPLSASIATEASPEIGIAVRDISPQLPIRLAGYAARKRAADKQDSPLLAEALAFKNPTGERFVFVALDNCEVNHAFLEPVRQQLQQKLQLNS